jgi:hypothetical protein
MKKVQNLSHSHRADVERPGDRGAVLDRSLVDRTLEVMR